MSAAKARPLMGFCPIGKFVFSHADAIFQKQSIERKLASLAIDYVGIDAVLPDGIIRDISQVDLVVEFFGKQSIDCLFMPHCNFGTESVVGLLGTRLKVPVLIWGPRDGMPLVDGTRLRDSLCGMFASTKVLNTLQVPFTYIENCHIDDQAFENGLDMFRRAANVVRKLQRARIGFIGNRIDFFWSTIVNENELLQKFGIEVLPFDLVRIIRLTRERAMKDRNTYLDEILRIGTAIDLTSMDPEAVLNNLALRDVLLGLATEHGLSAIAVESFMSITEELKAMISFAQAQVTEAGIPCITESDIHGAISSIIAEAAALNRSPSFFADLTIRHPENDNGLLLWHDAFPYCLKAPDSPASIGTHWILPDIDAGTCHWRLKDGEVTIVRFDASSGAYSLVAQKASSIAGPYTQNTYLWVEMANWKSFERKMIEGPYIHHVACVYGDHVAALKEACKYINNLRFDE
jgi:L-fucose isomerase-like protein